MIRETSLVRHAPKIGAVAYVLWGIMHVGAAISLFARLPRGGAAYVALVGSGLPPQIFDHDYDPVTLGVFWQHAFNLGMLGIFAIVIAVLNWKNSRIGYWLNLLVIGATDLGFIIAILAPGYIKLADGLGGPALYVIAAVFTSWGRLSGEPHERTAFSDPAPLVRH